VDAPILRVEVQRTNMDCSIAVLAMLLGKTYEEVLQAAARVIPNVLECGATWPEMRKVARKLGFTTRIKKGPRISIGEDVGALCIRGEKWKADHLVVLKEDLIVDTDGTIWEPEVYFSVNDCRPLSLMVFEPSPSRIPLRSR
jgi:ABC-type bacteriocin/lantibiotic exporter with double-glycine peptidase domain